MTSETRICPLCRVEFTENETLCPGHRVPLKRIGSANWSIGLVPRAAVAALIDLGILGGSAAWCSASWSDWRAPTFIEWTPAIVSSIVFAIVALVESWLLITTGSALGRKVAGLDIFESGSGQPAGAARLFARSLLAGFAIIGPVCAALANVSETFDLDGGLLVAGIIAICDALPLCIPPHRSLRDYLFGTRLAAV